MLLNKLYKISHIYKTQGIHGISKKIKSLLKLFYFRSYNIYTLDIENNAKNKQIDEQLVSTKQLYDVRLWTNNYMSENKNSYLETRSEIDIDNINKWMSHGHQTIVVTHRQSKKIIGDMWLAFDGFPFPGACDKLSKWLLDNGYCYSYMAYVQPIHRGNRLLPWLVQEQLRIVNEKKKRGLMALIMPKSKSSQKSFLSMGFRKKGTLYVVRLLPKKFSWTHLY